MEALTQYHATRSYGVIKEGFVTAAPRLVLQRMDDDIDLVGG